MSRGTCLPEPFRTIVSLLEEMDGAPEGLELYDWTVLKDGTPIDRVRVPLPRTLEDAFVDEVPVLGINFPEAFVAFSVGGTYNGVDFRAGWNEGDRVAALVYSPARVA